MLVGREPLSGPVAPRSRRPLQGLVIVLLMTGLWDSSTPDRRTRPDLILLPNVIALLVDVGAP